MSTGSPMGDVLRAWQLLGATDTETRARIAESLGMVWTPVEPRKLLDAKPVRETPLPSRTPLPPSQPPKPEQTPRALTIEYTPPDPFAMAGDQILGNESMEVRRELKPFPPKPPLLNPKWMRGIFSSRLSRAVPGRELDFALILRHELRAKVLRRLPWRRVLTVSAGVRCYVDLGAPLDLLLDDRVQVLRSLRALAGFERVAYGSFETVPDAPDARLDESAEPVTAPDAPVLILTDFGHYALPGRRWAVPSEWLAYLARERARGTSRIVALTPLAPEHWPAPLVPELDIVLWDWPTGVAKSRRHVD